MGFFNPYKPCPECGEDALEEEGIVFVKRVFCKECGHEPERSEVLNMEGGVFSDSDNQNKTSTKCVCRECREEVSPDVERCPNCGWKPKKRGGLWWGTTALMSLNPIGWVMGAKGASDNYKAKKGVAEEVLNDDEADHTQSSEETPTEALKRLHELKEQGVISENEFEDKKKELLEKI